MTASSLAAGRSRIMGRKLTRQPVNWSVSSGPCLSGSGRSPLELGILERQRPPIGRSGRVPHADRRRSTSGRRGRHDGAGSRRSPRAIPRPWSSAYPQAVTPGELRWSSQQGSSRSTSGRRDDPATSRATAFRIARRHYDQLTPTGADSRTGRSSGSCPRYPRPNRSSALTASRPVSHRAHSGEAQSSL